MNGAWQVLMTCAVVTVHMVNVELGYPQVVPKGGVLQVIRIFPVFLCCQVGAVLLRLLFQALLPGNNPLTRKSNEKSNLGLHMCNACVLVALQPSSIDL